MLEAVLKARCPGMPTTCRARKKSRSRSVPHGPRNQDVRDGAAIRRMLVRGWCERRFVIADSSDRVRFADAVRASLPAETDFKSCGSGLEKPALRATTTTRSPGATYVGSVILSSVFLE